MPEKTALEKEQEDAAAKAKAAQDKAHAESAAKHMPQAQARQATAPTVPSPQPSTDPAAFWPDDQPHNYEEPPRDQVYPPTDRQANQDQVAVAETYRTPDGYLVTKHPAAAAMVNKVAAVNDAHRALGIATGHGDRSLSQRKAVAAPAAVSDEDVEEQMKSKRKEIIDLEQSLSEKRHDLDGLLRQKNFRTAGSRDAAPATLS